MDSGKGEPKLTRRLVLSFVGGAFVLALVLWLGAVLLTRQSIVHVGQALLAELDGATIETRDVVGVVVLASGDTIADVTTEIASGDPSSLSRRRLFGATARGDNRDFVGLRSGVVALLVGGRVSEQHPVFQIADSSQVSTKERVGTLLIRLVADTTEFVRIPVAPAPLQP